MNAYFEKNMKGGHDTVFRLNLEIKKLKMELETVSSRLLSCSMEYERLTESIVKSEKININGQAFECLAVVE